MSTNAGVVCVEAKDGGSGQSQSGQLMYVTKFEPRTFDVRSRNANRREPQWSVGSPRWRLVERADECEANIKMNLRKASSTGSLADFQPAVQD